MSTTIFEKIAKLELPAHIVWEDDVFMAFLSIDPVADAHTLVIPKANWGDNLFKLDESKYSELMLASKKVAKLLEQKIECDRVLMWVEGFEVPHVHVHLVPANKPYNDLKIEKETKELTDLETVYAKLTD